jgi:hypothetical protein
MAFWEAFRHTRQVRCAIKVKRGSPGDFLTGLYKPLILGSIWGGVGVFVPSVGWAYLPRYVHVTLGLPWFAYLFFLMGVLVPVFLYLGISWYFKKELEKPGHGKHARDEDVEE